MGSVDPRMMHVLIKRGDRGRWKDCSKQIVSCCFDGSTYSFDFDDGRHEELFADQVQIYDQVSKGQDVKHDAVYVNGDLWPRVETLWEVRKRDNPQSFRYTLGARLASGELRFYHRSDKDVCVVPEDPELARVRRVMEYVQEEVREQARCIGATRHSNGRKAWWTSEGNVKPEVLLASLWEELPKAPSGSALEAYLRGTNSAQTGANDRIVMPFHSNIDQRNAIRSALENQISVIDGPPGTGKTQTILNLIATLVAQGKTVGIVAGANSAVENVVDKRAEEGYDFLVAALGSSDRVTKFCASQTIKDKKRADWQESSGQRLKELPEVMTPEALCAEEEHLVSLWQDSREIPKIRSLLTDTQREHSVLEEKVRESGRTIPDISHLSIVSKNSETLADLLALARCVPSPGRGIRGLIERVRRYFEYGPLKGLDLADTDVQSAIQAAFYRARERELAKCLEEAEDRTADHGLVEVAEDYRQHSREALDAVLLRRFAHRPLTHVDATELRNKTDKLLSTYPIVASTCFSIRNNLAAGALLDWVIIDESSQVLLPQGMAALSKARNAVIVGDDKQLSPVFRGWDESKREPPEARFDVRSLSLLDSVKMMPKSARVPNTLLKEHYRCHPAIIEFCNRTYYDGQLIPMRDPGADTPEPLTVVYAAPGNHARHPLHGGGRFSQREIDIIAQLQEMQVLRGGGDRRG